MIYHDELVSAFLFMTVSEYYKSIFGQKVYKLSLDAGCTCPTRDGTLGTGGCIFCSASGSGDFTASRQFSISQQVEQAKALLAPKLKGREVQYIAYFQNFTNTYGYIPQLKKKWQEALQCPGVVGLSLGTRPDCLGEEVLQALGEICEPGGRFSWSSEPGGRFSRSCEQEGQSLQPDLEPGGRFSKPFLQIELGLQTSSQSSAQYIRRGFSNQTYVNAVKALHQLNPSIHVVTHIIFGLPGESRQQMLDSVKFAVDSGTNGIKITNLYVLKGTDLCRDYEAGKVKCLEMEEYFDIVREAVGMLPPGVLIHRLTGDPPKSLVVAPMWCCNKKMTMNLGKGILERK
ncbi:MAG: TIGR01212 family radical SAM protein [Treponema sp.]|nr:TIGR01212 family radical SAM protein [Treponema sp.]